MFYIATLLGMLKHLYNSEKKMAPKQILVELLLKSFSMKMCVHLKRHVPAALLNNLRVTLVHQNLWHMFAVSKLRWWSPVATFVDFVSKISLIPSFPLLTNKVLLLLSLGLL